MQSSFLCLVLEHGVGETWVRIVHAESCQTFIVPVFFMRFLKIERKQIIIFTEGF